MYFTDCPLILFDITVIQALAFIRNRFIQIYQNRETYTSQNNQERDSDISVSYTHLNNDVPIYNFPLGVWNLKKSPQIIRNVEGEIGMYYDAGYFTYEYEVGDYEILVNPVVSQEYRVYSKANLLFKSNSYASAPPFGYINEMKYYGGGSSFSTDILEGDSSDKHFHAHYPIKKDDLLIHLYVELINKNNPDIKFSFSKYFATGDIIEGTSNICLLYTSYCYQAN